MALSEEQRLEECSYTINGLVDIETNIDTYRLHEHEYPNNKVVIQYILALYGEPKYEKDYKNIAVLASARADRRVPVRHVERAIQEGYKYRRKWSVICKTAGILWFINFGISVGLFINSGKHVVSGSLFLWGLLLLGVLWFVGLVRKEPFTFENCFVSRRFRR